MDNFVGALIINVISMVFVGLSGSVAASFPTESEFWWTSFKLTLLLIAVGSVIGAVFQIYTNLILDYISKLIVINIFLFYMMVIAWRSAGESMVFGIILFTLYAVCIYVGIRYREFVQQESFRPKTKIGKAIVSIGVLSSGGAGFTGYNIGRSEGGRIFSGGFISCTRLSINFILQLGVKADRGSSGGTKTATVVKGGRSKWWGKCCREPASESSLPS
ncbi:hypothetical protein [Kroppenstedtia eburnea]|uniref:hypothetical protein n=1 Tax=Kroppenstedtia eburnea TaxID=714067 RepID=UPI0011799F0C|nr:hypothetical protein [Kroppenstedtia eburnea]QKI80709.1 hypothetical protein GXN75_01020 [Kroppenstedtia eburnea]